MAAAPKVPQSRPPSERMLRIQGLLQHGKRPNCSALAKQLEISVKTAQRDIEFMRDRLNLPIDYDRTTHGYFTFVQGFRGHSTLLHWRT
jgi:predicted DNA-binding transcriptional regulator YafY